MPWVNGPFCQLVEVVEGRTGEQQRGLPGDSMAQWHRKRPENTDKC